MYWLDNNSWDTIYVADPNIALFFEEEIYIQSLQDTNQNPIVYDIRKNMMCDVAVNQSPEQIVVSVGSAGNHLLNATDCWVGRT